MTDQLVELPAGFAAPRYGEASLADVLPSAVSAIGLSGPNPLGLKPTSSVVVLVVDGLGAEQLRAHRGLAPFLDEHLHRDIDAVFPSTTAASLSAIGTGLPPGGNGITGYAMALPDHDQPLNLLRWNIGLRGGGFDARTTVVPEDFQPRPTALERADDLGARVAVVLDPMFVDSGLTRAALRGGTRVEAVGLARTIEAALAGARGRGPNLVYAHHPDVDTAGHVFGAGSEPWCQAVAAVDDELRRLADHLPRDTTLIVTADHGMVNVDADDVVEISEHDDLTSGVRIFGGEPRCRQLWCHPGAREDVVSAWSDRLDGRAIVVAREDAIGAGWFGVVEDHVVDRIGEVVVVATHGSVAHREVDPVEGRMFGQHGSLSRAELAVPFIVLRS